MIQATAVEEPEPGAESRGLPLIAASLAVLGIALYAYLSYVYDQFYDAVSVDKSDVGLSYTETLARSSGWIALASILTCVGFLMAGLVRLTAPLLVVTVPPPGIADTRWELIGSVISNATAYVLAFSMFWVFALSPVIYAVALPLKEQKLATRAVQAGQPVSPVRIYGFPLLGIRADAAEVAPSSAPGQRAALDGLRGQKLLYLGRADGVVVLYDPQVKRSLYLPVGDVVIRLSRPPSRRDVPPHCIFQSWPLRRLPGC